MARRVALLIETSKTFGRGLLLGVGQYARIMKNWSFFVEERGLDDPAPTWLTRGDFDGLIARTRDAQQMSRLAKLGIPMVSLGEENPSEVTSISSDDGVVAEQVAEHFLERQFRNFGYVGLRGNVWSDNRRDRFVECLGQLGHHCAVLEADVSEGLESAWYHRRGELANWLARLPQPVAVMACYDATARTLLDVCRERGIVVPEQISVVGVDNDEVLCELSDPPLSSVQLDTSAIGFEAARLLDKLMQSENPFSVPHQRVVIPPSGIVCRSSSNVDAIEDSDVSAALGYIRRHACSGIDVNDVVANVPLSRRTLERRFEMAIGCTPLAEIKRIRLDRVKELLTETDLKLDEIARLAGYSYTAYMVAQFRKTEGRTPGSYRQQQ